MFDKMRVGVMMTVLCAGAVPAQAEISFQAVVATHNEPGPSTKNTPPDETRTTQVVLSDRRMSITSSARAELYDFAGMRRYDIDLKTGTYVDYSLFDAVGFRVMEMQNRVNIGKAMAAAKLDTALFDPVFAAQALSIPAQPVGTLTEVADGPDTVLAIDGKPLLRFGAGGEKVSADDAAAFVRYLRYQVGGHPLVLAKLAKLGRVPAKFVMYYRETGGTQTRTFTISGLTTAPSPSIDLAKFTARADSDNEIDRVLDRARQGAHPVTAEDRQKFASPQNTAFADKRGLDLLLGEMEWVLMTGEEMKPLASDRLALVQGDPLVRKFASSVNPGDKAGFSAAIQTLQSLRSQTMSKRHMLLLYEANDRVKLGERDTLPMFASVLRTNPGLAGAYKDLGDVLFINFDMPRAWRSWDQGRRIAPQLNLFDAVNQFEQKLLRDHPEYF